MRFRTKSWFILFLSLLCLNLIALFTPNIQKVHAHQYLFYDGFETGDLSLWDGNETEGLLDISVSTLNPHNDTYCCRFNGTSAGSTWAYIYKTVTPAQTTFHARMYFRVHNLTTSIRRQVIKLLADGGSTEACRASLRYASSHYRIYVQRFFNTSQSQYSSWFDLSADTWYWMELGYRKDDSNGYVKAWFNGSIVLQWTSIDTTGCNDLDTVRFGEVYHEGVDVDDIDFRIDDCAIDDDEIGAGAGGGGGGGGSPSMLFETGFETGDLSEVQTEITDPASIVVNQENPHAGSYSAEIYTAIGGPQGRGRIVKSPSPALTECYVRSYVFIDYWDGYIQVLRYAGYSYGYYTYICTMVIDYNKVRLQIGMYKILAGGEPNPGNWHPDGETGPLTLEQSTTIQTGKWHYFEMYFKNGASGNATCWMNGQQMITYASGMTGAPDIAKIKTGVVLYETNCDPANLYVDDFGYNGSYIGGKGGQEDLAPNKVILNAPPHSGELTDYSINFNYTPTFYQGQIQNSCLWINKSGTWQNVKWNTTTIQNDTLHTISYTLPSLNVSYIWNVQVWNTTTGHFASNNWNFTLSIFIEDEGPPQWSNLQVNTTEAGMPVQISCRWTDNKALHGYIFGCDFSGSWINDSFVSLSGTSDTMTVTKTFPNTTDFTVHFSVWCNDTAGNTGSMLNVGITTTGEGVAGVAGGQFSEPVEKEKKPLLSPYAFRQILIICIIGVFTGSAYLIFKKL